MRTCTAPTCKQTHEQFIAAVASLAMAGLAPSERAKLDGIKLVYGAGPQGVRGVTYFNRWTGNGETRPFVEISAFTQESWLQVAGTTIHELGHVLAGWAAGHGPDWHKACAALGLRKIKAGGTAYKFANFEPRLREAIAALPRPDDGEPVANLMGGAAGLAGLFGPRGGALKGCQAGIGTRGGKSRGAGSGSRLRLFECDCPSPVKVRVARDEFHAHCDICTGGFHFVK